MSCKKFLFYLKGKERPIVATDTDERTLEELEDDISSIFSSNSVSVFRTKNDSILVKSPELQSVVIQKVNKKKNKNSLEDESATRVSDYPKNDSL